MQKKDKKPTPFGALLRTIRELNHLTRADMADELRVSRAHLYALEMGKHDVPVSLVSQVHQVYHQPYGILYNMLLQSNKKVTIDLNMFSRHKRARFHHELLSTLTALERRKK